MKNTLTTLKLNLTSKKARVLPPKTIVKKQPDHHQKFRKLLPRLSWRLCCFRRDARPTRVWSHGDANQAGVMRKTARPATPNDSGVPRPGRNCSTSQVLRFERQSVLMAVSSGFGQPEVEAELPKREQLPNDNHRANATFKVYLKSLPRPAAGSPTGSFRADAGLVVYLFANEVLQKLRIVRIVAVARANPPSFCWSPYQNCS